MAPVGGGEGPGGWAGGLRLGAGEPMNTWGGGAGGGGVGGGGANEHMAGACGRCALWWGCSRALFPGGVLMD